ncbi:hypothetical protein TD95_001059 [Thielaviopsis punctulata]|uniref:Myb-like domain-containing protein n=1 Tax=Thielaviopsis punctulata TaxID=72032 RepID=A0A0F4ZAS4_9PEZI|nr:hypothetical protein TD95_001069 [Thielaviopsis punctulata]KKA26953.1 hypothetical protein TD95_001059 [Thielaviopsis punctulata]
MYTMVREAPPLSSSNTSNSISWPTSNPSNSPSHYSQNESLGRPTINLDITSLIKTPYPSADESQDSRPSTSASYPGQQSSSYPSSTASAPTSGHMSYAQPPPAYVQAGLPPPALHHHHAHSNMPPHSRHAGSMPLAHPQVASTKRGLTHVSDSPAKKQSKWSPEEDALIIELRGGGMKWEDISKRLPGRSAISCRLHYQNYLERRSEWDEERKNKLARLYERFKPEMWQKVAEELAVPWRAAEAMHWRMGEEEMAKRAGVVPFSLSVNDSSSHRNTLSRGHSQPPPRSDYSATLPHHPHGHPGYSRHHTMPHSHSMSLGQAPPPPPPHHMSHGAHLGPMSHPRSIPTPAPPPSTLPRRDAGATTLPPPIPMEQQLPHSELAPLHPQQHSHARSSGLLPSVAELTTGVSPYSTPAYSMGGHSLSPVAQSEPSPGPPLLPSISGYPPTASASSPYESVGSKRRASPEGIPRDGPRRYYDHPDDATRRRMA